MVEALHSQLSERSSTPTSAPDSSSAGLRGDERFFSSAVEQTCIVQAGHDAEQSVEASHSFGRTIRAPRMKLWQADVNDMGEASESFAACTRDTISLRDQVTMRDQPRCRAIFKGCDLLCGLRDCRCRRLSFILHRGSGRQQAQDPNGALMCVAPARRLQHGVLRFATNNGKSFS
jgi:hypothetical protein